MITTRSPFLRVTLVTSGEDRATCRAEPGELQTSRSAAQKTYFLHENQPIYNGFVERITPDSVVFKEHYLDNLGHDSQREVVKTVNAPVV